MMKLHVINLKITVNEIKVLFKEIQSVYLAHQFYFKDQYYS